MERDKNHRLTSKINLSAVLSTPLNRIHAFFAPIFTKINGRTKNTPIGRTSFKFRVRERDRNLCLFKDHFVYSCPGAEKIQLPAVREISPIIYHPIKIKSQMMYFVPGWRILCGEQVKKFEQFLLFFHGAPIMLLLKSVQAAVSLLAQLHVSEAMCSFVTKAGCCM